jgi:hypothetical protein
MRTAIAAFAAFVVLRVLAAVHVIDADPVAPIDAGIAAPADPLAAGD